MSQQPVSAAFIQKSVQAVDNFQKHNFLGTTFLYHNPKILVDYIIIDEAKFQWKGPKRQELTWLTKGIHLVWKIYEISAK